MSVISSSFKPPGVCCLGLSLDFGAAVWPQVRQLCRKSCAERAMRSEVCPALLCNSCPGQAVPQQCWLLSATDLCATRNSCSHQTCSLTMNRGGDSGGTFWQSCLHPCLPHFRPQLLADLDLWSSLPLMKLGGILLCPQTQEDWILPWLHPWGIIFQICVVCSY